MSATVMLLGSTNIGQRKCASSTCTSNKAPTTSERGEWINQALDNAMEVVKSITSPLKGATRPWYISFTNLSNHLNKKTRSRKVRPHGMLTEDGNATIVAWTLTMQICG
jgi:hypothetical protein